MFFFFFRGSFNEAFNETEKKQHAIEEAVWRNFQSTLILGTQPLDRVTTWRMIPFRKWMIYTHAFISPLSQMA